MAIEFYRHELPKDAGVLSAGVDSSTRSGATTADNTSSCTQAESSTPLSVFSELLQESDCGSLGQSIAESRTVDTSSTLLEKQSSGFRKFQLSNLLYSIKDSLNNQYDGARREEHLTNNTLTLNDAAACSNSRIVTVPGSNTISSWDDRGKRSQPYQSRLAWNNHGMELPSKLLARAHHGHISGTANRGILKTKVESRGENNSARLKHAARKRCLSAPARSTAQGRKVNDFSNDTHFCGATIEDKTCACRPNVQDTPKENAYKGYKGNHNHSDQVFLNMALADIFTLLNIKEEICLPEPRVPDANTFSNNANSDYYQKNRKTLVFSGQNYLKKQVKSRLITSTSAAAGVEKDYPINSASLMTNTPNNLYKTLDMLKQKACNESLENYNFSKYSSNERVGIRHNASCTLGNLLSTLLPHIDNVHSSTSRTLEMVKSQLPRHEMGSHIMGVTKDSKKQSVFDSLCHKNYALLLDRQIMLPKQDLSISSARNTTQESDSLCDPPLPVPHHMSLGTQNHPDCRPCVFYWTRGCTNGDNCEFCHFQHPPKVRKRRKQRVRTLQ